MPTSAHNYNIVNRSRLGSHGWYLGLEPTARLIDSLEFNGTFSTVRLYRAFRSYSLRFKNRNTLGALYISYSVVDDQRHK